VAVVVLLLMVFVAVSAALAEEEQEAALVLEFLDYQTLVAVVVVVDLITNLTSPAVAEDLVL
jgi:hypothetical protein